VDLWREAAASSVRWEDHYQYLGCELGTNPRATLIAQYMNEAKKLFENKLTTWQKLDAVSFIQIFTKNSEG